MTKRTPDYYRMNEEPLPLRQQEIIPQPWLPTMPTMSSHAATRVTEKRKAFVIADMDGRPSKDNRVCATCAIGLDPSQASQVNWHITTELPCRLCEVLGGKPEAFTKPFCDFLHENPTIFHTVDYFKAKLRHVGFEEVSCPLWQADIQSFCTHLECSSLPVLISV